MRDRRRIAGELSDEALEVALDQRRRLLFGGVLYVERPVTETTDDEAVIGGLLPVGVSVAGVVRAGEQAPLERLGDDDLSARRLDDRVEPGKQAAGVAVGGDHDLVRLELGERCDLLSLSQLGARPGREPCESPHPAGRLKRTVSRMEDGTVVPTRQRSG